MTPTRTTLAGVVAALAAIAIAAPVSTAGAATATPTVVGSTYITSAPASFTNTNNQTSTQQLSMGSQIAP